MTGPLGGGNSLGNAYVNIRARTEKFGPDVEDALRKDARDVQNSADKLGGSIGDNIGTGLNKHLSKQGPAISKTITEAVNREKIDVKPDFRYNVRGRNGRFISRAAAQIQEEVGEAFSRATGSGGIFNKFTDGIRDAIGAAFDVPGKSPLTTALIPVFIALGGLIGAALQAANALVATLTVIPGLIAAISLQAGVLFLAFKGVGGAIAGAFAAKNAKELKAALVDVTPAAATFVKALLPLRDLFQDLQYWAQQSFFKSLGTSVITAAIKNIEPILRTGVIPLATALGGAAKTLLGVFASPVFHEFLATVVPATVYWIDHFAPALASLLDSFIRIGDAAMPFFNSLGSLVNSGLAALAKDLSDLASDPKFTKWLTDMFQTLMELGPLVKAAFGFVVTFLDQLNKAGGDALITSLTDVLNLLTKFLATEAGMRALNALIGIAIASFYVLAGAAIAVLYLLGAVQAFVQWMTDVGFPAIGDFFTWLGGYILGFFRTVGDAILGFFDMVGQWVIDIVHKIGQFFTDLWDGFIAKKDSAVDHIKRLPGELMSALGDLSGLLLNAGKNLINGLINGIKAAIPSLKSTLSGITNLLPDWKGPEDKDRKILKPAGEAVMEGFGQGLLIGASDIAGLLGSFTDGLGGIGVNSNTSNITLGANAVQVNFRGAAPTQAEAQNTGMAVGNGIVSQLASRNTRLAVRTL